MENSAGAAERSRLEGIKGWLLFYCVAQLYIVPALVGVSILLVVLPAVLGSPHLPADPLGSIVRLAIVTYIVGYNMYLARRLWKLDAIAVEDTKSFLIFSLLLGLALNLIVPPRGYYPDDVERITMIMRDIVWPAAWMVGWYIYFDRSERVRLTYNLLPRRVVCRNLNCGASIKLDALKWRQRAFTCPKCNIKYESIDVTG
jgi:hypothetical protein